MIRMFPCTALFCLVAGVLTVAGQSYERGLIGHWPLAGDCRDHSGGGNHGRNVGADLSAPGPDGRPAGAARFDGRGNWIEIPAARAIELGTRDSSVAVWVRAEDHDDVPGDIFSQYDPVRRRGFCLSIKRHDVTTNLANDRTVHFGIDNGQIEPEWTDHGRPGRAVLVYALAVYEGQLYAGTCEPGKDESGHVYRFDGATRWVDCGSPDRANAVSALAAFDGRLYAGTSKYRLAGSSLQESENPHLGGKVHRYDDGTWADCGQLPDTEGIGGLTVFRGRLHASSLYRPAGFFRYERGQTWTRLQTPGGKRVEAMCVWNGQLFATSYDEAHVYRYDGTAWTDCGQLGGPENTQTYSCAVYEGRLYVGTWRSGRVFRYLADDQWEDVGRLGEELEVMGMLVHNGKLYAGTLPLAEVYRYDGGTTWSRAGRVDHTPDVRYRRAWTMAEFQGRLFCGTLPSGHVLSIAAGTSVTYDHRLGPGWRHIGAVKQGGRLSLYVDGRLVATSDEFDPAAYDLTSDQPFRIGYGPNDYFHGSLADLRLYRRALSDADIGRLAESRQRK